MAKNKKHGHNEAFVFNNADAVKLGKEWHNIYTTENELSFTDDNFETAMLNVIKNPNINSTVVLRADILSEKFKDEDATVYNDVLKFAPPNDDDDILMLNLDDIRARSDIIDTLDSNFKFFSNIEIVRRIVPRNSNKDHIINQTCLVLKSDNDDLKDSSLIIYTPHFDSPSDCPYYLPNVQSVGIFYHNKKLSVHYLPFEITSNGTEDVNELAPQIFNDENLRDVRIAYRLLQTARKHSNGLMNGYEKKVVHDQIINKIDFQNRYTKLKKKYSKFLIDNWIESTDPKKHVFEDISIAAFLIELWIKIYGIDFKQTMQFRDLGCGNGVLVYILISEGIRGFGIDARKRKSWSIFPSNIQNFLKEQIIIPSIIVRPHPSDNINVSYNSETFHLKNSSDNDDDTESRNNNTDSIISSEQLINSPHINLTDSFPLNTFIIGNHSDELTCWIPLLGYPYLVIPCCSHGFSGERVRYAVRKNEESKTGSIFKNKNGNSTYAGLVSQVEYLSNQVGWNTQIEMLRIPSTRNVGVIGYENQYDLESNFPVKKVHEIVSKYGGANGWIDNTMSLMKRKNPKDH